MLTLTCNNKRDKSSTLLWELSGKENQLVGQSDSPSTGFNETFSQYPLKMDGFLKIFFLLFSCSANHSASTFVHIECIK